VSNSSQRSMISSLVYTVLIPMLNPFIYTLRNKDMQSALGRLLSRAAPCSSCTDYLRTKWKLLSLRNMLLIYISCLFFVILLDIFLLCSIYKALLTFILCVLFAFPHSFLRNSFAIFFLINDPLCSKFGELIRFS
jgi:hypothetical protein